MGIASLVLGIVSIIIGFIPFFWLIAFIPALVGLILGIISVIKKKDKGKSITGIVLCAITLLLVISSYQNLSSSTSSTTSTNIETGIQQTTSNEELKKNITVEALGLTKNGDFAFKVKNNNSQTVFISSVNTIFKDSAGNFMEKADSQEQYFGISANSEIVNYAWGFNKDFSKYPNYEFEFELSSDWINSSTICDNFELTANNTGKQISVQAKNNNDFSAKNVSVLVAYYKNGNIVGCQMGGTMMDTTSANGTAYINVSYPEDSNYKEISFDDYKVYLTRATKNNN